MYIPDCTQTVLFFQKAVSVETQSMRAPSGRLNKYLYVLCAAQQRSLHIGKSSYADIAHCTGALRSARHCS